MKLRFVLIVLLPLLVLVASCQKDECEAPPVGENIVGTWQVDGQSGTVVFQADGTLLDPNDLLIDGEVNGMVLDEKSWMLVPGDYLLLRAENGSTSLESEFYIAGERLQSHLARNLFCRCGSETKIAAVRDVEDRIGLRIAPVGCNEPNVSGVVIFVTCHHIYLGTYEYLEDRFTGPCALFLFCLR